MRVRPGSVSAPRPSTRSSNEIDHARTLAAQARDFYYLTLSAQANFAQSGSDYDYQNFARLRAEYDRLTALALGAR